MGPQVQRRWVEHSHPLTAQDGLLPTAYLLRRELGRYGAIAVAVYFLISPSILYFSRFVRNDVYMAVWAMALLTILFRYIERPKTSLLVAWSVIWALAYATKESSYLLAGTFGLFLLVMAAPSIWRWCKGELALSRVGPAGDLFIVLGTLSLPLWSPLSGLIQTLLGITLVNPDPNDPRVQAGTLIRVATETGAPVGGGFQIPSDPGNHATAQNRVQCRTDRHHQSICHTRTG